MLGDWQADWIWDDSGEHPVNHWLCFRKHFSLRDAVEEATLHIVADSRYWLYVNGRLIGRGPMRSWPDELYYDSYDAAQDLSIGENTIAVLVHHFGISTFQSIEAPAGLIARLEWRGKREAGLVMSDESWRVLPHAGYERRVPRISCQQGWAEVYDANRFDADWMMPDFDDRAWLGAKKANLANDHRTLIPRDIPFLASEWVPPKTVLLTQEVAPKGLNVTVDLRPVLFQDAFDANARVFTAYLVSTIRASKPMRGKVTFPWPRGLALFGDFRINDRIYRRGEARQADIELDAGDNLFLMDISARSNGFFFYMNLELENACEISFAAPFSSQHRFAVLGPFAAKQFMNIGVERDNAIDWDDPLYRAAFLASTPDELKRYRALMSFVSEENVSDSNVWMDSVFQTAHTSTDAPPVDGLSMPEAKDGCASQIMLDFGRQTSGFLTFEVTAPSGAVLDFYGLEYLGEDGRAEHTEGLNNCLRYVSAGGRQRYQSVVRRGLRYLAVTAWQCEGAVHFHQLQVEESLYPALRQGEFSCSDEQLNQIWEISARTIRLCMEDVFVDCPAYEQVFWVGDLRIAALAAYHVRGAYALARHSLLLAAKSVRRSGVVECQAPSGHQALIPAWTLFWMDACKDYFDYTKDMDFLRAVYEPMKQSADFFIDRLNGMGLLQTQAFNMLDWAGMDTPDDGIVAHQNMSLVKSLAHLSEIANQLCDAQAKEYYADASAKLKDAVRRHLWDDAVCAYIDCIHADGARSTTFSLQTQMMAYLSDCYTQATQATQARLEAILLNPPESFVRIGSPFASFFYFQALEKAGHAGLVLEKIRTLWGGMLQPGATTCWETFPGYEQGRLTRSHCHAWSASPAYFLHRYVLGFRAPHQSTAQPQKPPDFPEIEWARGAVPVLQNDIQIKWTRYSD